MPQLVRRTSSQSSGDRRLCLTLSPRVELEALVLECLDSVPPRRRQEWLRGLLVAGLVQQRTVIAAARESRSGASVLRRNAVGSGRSLRESAFGAWLAGETKAERVPSATVKLVPRAPAPTRAGSGEKPFAHLRRVIGA